MPKFQFSRYTSSLTLLAVVAWVGGLWATGYLAVPALFYAQSDRLLAGLLAGVMFQKVAWLGFVCGGFLLLKWWRQRHLGFWLVFTMLLLSASIQFGWQPMMAELKTHNISQAPYRQQFAMLHGISSLCYLLESLLGLWLVLSLASARRGKDGDGGWL